jgi:hypothetical protein
MKSYYFIYTQIPNTDKALYLVKFSLIEATAQLDNNLNIICRFDTEEQAQKVIDTLAKAYSKSTIVNPLKVGMVQFEL